MSLELAFAALGVAALLARVGFALYAAGLVRSKNSAGMVTRLMCDLCLTFLVFWAVGAAILFPSVTRSQSPQSQPNPILSLDTRLLFSNPSTASTLFFHGVMILMVSGAVAGATAERFRFFPLCGASLLLGGLLLPICGYWAWFGWLQQRGFLDIGGGTALHVSAGICAAVAAILVGPRTGKFNRDGSSSMIPGHNLPLAAVGTLLLMVGWLAYLTGSGLRASDKIASLAALHGLLAAAAAGFVALLIGQLRYGKPDVVLAMMGFVSGLVAISAGAGIVGAPGAAIIGAVAGAIIPLATVTLDLRIRIDDPAGVIAIHTLAGAWGTLAVGLFARPADGNHLHLLATQSLGILAIAAFSAVVSLIFFGALRATVGIRAKEADEFDGLDLAEHDIGAYPDFQQTMIKSYHLREM